MEGHCWTGQSPQWAVVPVEEKRKRFALIAARVFAGECVRVVSFCANKYRQLALVYWKRMLPFRDHIFQYKSIQKLSDKLQ